MAEVAARGMTANAARWATMDALFAELYWAG